MPSEVQSPPATRTRIVTELASVRRRLLSMVYEFLLVVSIFMLLVVLPGAVIGQVSGVTPPALVLWVYLFLLFGVYFIFFWLRRGQTLPMQTWRLRLVREDGLPLTVWQALLRYLLSWLSLACCGIGFLWVFIDRDRQFLHDRLARTCIVLLPRAAAQGA